MLSVIVCTYNRCEILKQTLPSLLQQNFPSENYEIIVVDNNSTDNTAEVVAEFNPSQAQDSGNKQIRYVQEPRQGLSYARNKGAEVAKGEIIVYIDDDAIADKEWLAGLYEIYEKYEDVDCVGGQIQLLWQGERPSWMPSEYESVLGKFDFGPEPIDAGFPHGGNLSLKKILWDKVGGFNTNLGRQGKGLLSMEEKEFCHRIRESGGKFMCTPHALVHHIIPPERMTKKYLRRRLYWEGISQIICDCIRHPKKRTRLVKDALIFSKNIMKVTVSFVKASVMRDTPFIYEGSICFLTGRLWFIVRLIFSGRYSFHSSSKE